MQPADRAFDEPSADAQAMLFFSSLRDHWFDFEPTQNRAERLIIERLVGDELLRHLLRPAGLAPDFRQVHQQRDQRRDIMLVGG